PPLQPVRLRPAVGHHVAADLAPRAFDAPVPLALRDPHLTDGLHAGARGNRAFGQAIQDLTHDADRLTELDHANPITGKAVPGRLDGDDEVEILVRRVRLGAAPVVGPAGAADERARDADLLRELPRNDTDTLGTDEEERVVVEHRLVLVDAALDEVHRLTALLRPPRRHVVARPSDLVEAVQKPRARERLEEI